MANAVFPVPQYIDYGNSGRMSENLEKLSLNFQGVLFCGFVNHIHNIEYDFTSHYPDVNDNHKKVGFTQKR
jgi:hypothetical protein